MRRAWQGVSFGSFHKLGPFLGVLTTRAHVAGELPRPLAQSLRNCWMKIPGVWAWALGVISDYAPSCQLRSALAVDLALPPTQEEGSLAHGKFWIVRMFLPQVQLPLPLVLQTSIQIHRRKLLEQPNTHTAKMQAALTLHKLVDSTRVKHGPVQERITTPRGGNAEAEKS